MQEEDYGNITPEEPNAEAFGQPPREPPTNQCIPAQSDGDDSNNDRSETQKLEVDIRGAERWLIGIGVATLVINSVIALIYWNQLDQMRKATQAATNAANSTSDSLEFSNGNFDRMMIRTIDQTASQIKSSQAAEGAVKLAQKQMMLDQRPWVGLMGTNHISVQIVKDAPIKFRLQIQNVGKTPALEETSVNYLNMRPISDPMPSFGGYSQKDASATICLMPNAIANVDLATDTPGTAGFAINKLTDTDIDFIDTGKVQLFVYGTIWYKDTFKNSHKTDYCLQYIPPKIGTVGTEGSFYACPVHNYAD
jgi:hypothetical protein